MPRFLRALLVATLLVLTTVVPARASEGDDDGADGVVLIGMTGVEWTDVTEQATPGLWSLTQEAAIGNLVTRSVRSWSCAADGWLAVSSGKRAAAPLSPSGECLALEGIPATQWDAYVHAAESSTYGAVPGTFGEYLEDSGITAAGVGAGAAIALARTDGSPIGFVAEVPSVRELPDSPLVNLDAEEGDIADAVTRADPPVAPAATVSTVAAVTRALESDPDLLVIDLGGATSGTLHTSDVSKLDTTLRALLPLLEGRTVLVASLADAGHTPRLGIAALLGEGGVLQSSSTRQFGLLQATDVTPTLISLLGLEPLSGAAGAAATATAVQDTDVLAQLEDTSAHALAIRPLIAGFFAMLVAVNVGLYLVVALLMSGWVRSRFQSASALADRIAHTKPYAVRTLRGFATFTAALPAASYLANLLPWWRTGSPGWVLWGLVLAIAAAIAAVALLPPWPDAALAPLGVVGVITWLTLGAEVLTGSQMQLSGLMGYQILVAGRFYGFGNAAFVLFASSAVLVGLMLVHLTGQRRLLAAALLTAVGLVTVALDGYPSLGADFGGPPAILPAFIVFVLLALEVRLTWKRVGAVVGISAVVAVSFSVLDYLRPAEERTHLGRFVETVLDGGLLDVIVRKLSQNLTSLFASVLTILALAGIVLLVLAFSRRSPFARPVDMDVPTSQRVAVLEGLVRRVPAIRMALVVLTVLWGIGFAVNDSGVLIPAVGMALVVPLLIAVATGELLRGGAGASSSETEATQDA